MRQRMIRAARMVVLAVHYTVCTVLVVAFVVLVVTIAVVGGGK